MLWSEILASTENQTVPKETLQMWTENRFGPQTYKQQDLTDEFNTQLSEQEEQQFQLWAEENNRTYDLIDYDMRGAWKEGASQSENGHFPDKFKKPNHPTFSKESIYSNDENIGGEWIQKDGKYSFRPGKRVSPQHAEYLKKYFERAEKDSTLDLTGLVMTEEDMARRSPLSALHSVSPEPGLFDGVLEGTGKGVVYGLGRFVNTFMKGASHMVDYESANDLLAEYGAELDNEAIERQKQNASAFQKSFRSALNEKFGAKPQTMGLVGQVMHGVFSTIPEVVLYSSVLGLTGGALAFGLDMGVNRYDELRDKGVDESTAWRLAWEAGILNSIGARIPPALGANRLQSILYGSGSNVGLNLAEISSIKWTLDNQNYTDIAKQYDFNVKDMLVAGILGGVMGGAFFRKPITAENLRTDAFNKAQQEQYTRMYDALIKVRNSDGSRKYTDEQAALIAKKESTREVNLYEVAGKSVGDFNAVRPDVVFGNPKGEGNHLSPYFNDSEGIGKRTPVSENNEQFNEQGIIGSVDNEVGIPEGNLVIGLGKAPGNGYGEGFLHAYSNAIELDPKRYPKIGIDSDSLANDIIKSINDDLRNNEFDIYLQKRGGKYIFVTPSNEYVFKYKKNDKTYYLNTWMPRSVNQPPSKGKGVLLVGKGKGRLQPYSDGNSGIPSLFESKDQLNPKSNYTGQSNLTEFNDTDIVRNGQGQYELTLQNLESRYEAAVKSGDMETAREIVIEYARNRGYLTSDESANYAYNGTEKTRKLVDPIVFEKDGTIVPLRKRFDRRRAEEHYQRKAERVAGWEDFAKRKLGLTEYADISTLPHENSHWYLDASMQIAKEGGYSQEFANDLKVILKQFGLKSIDEWDALPIETKDRYHEQFSLWTEQYLTEGKSPNAEMRIVLQRFKDWIINVYKDLFEKYVPSSEDVSNAIGDRYKRQFDEALPKMSDEIRNLLDRSYKDRKPNKQPTNEQIAAARVSVMDHSRQVKNQLLISSDATPAERIETQDASDEATMKAIDQMLNGDPVDTSAEASRMSIDSDAYENAVNTFKNDIGTVEPVKNEEIPSQQTSKMQEVSDANIIDITNKANEALKSIAPNFPEITPEAVKDGIKQVQEIAENVTQKIQEIANGEIAKKRTQNSIAAMNEKTALDARINDILLDNPNEMTKIVNDNGDEVTVTSKQVIEMANAEVEKAQNEANGIGQAVMCILQNKGV